MNYKTLIETIISLIPGMITAIITGVVLLILEYKTNWFSKRVTKHKNPPGIQTGFYPGYLYRNPDWVETAVSIATAAPLILIVFVMISGVIGIPIAMITSNWTSTELDEQTAENVSVKTIGDKETKSFFDNDLYISVVAISTYNGAVTFIVGSPGYPDKKIENAVNGQSAIFLGNNYYDIRVTSISKDSFLGLFIGNPVADFTVTKFPK